MFVKLSLKNAKRSIKDYVIYIVTLTLCVSLFYAFMTLLSSDFEFTPGEQYDFTGMYIYIKFSTYVITACLLFLVSYVNKYMLNRRKREFANYILLGVEQSSVALMFFMETLFMGLVAIALGIILGSLFSQVLISIILFTIGLDSQFEFRLYLDTMRQTLLFFIVIFAFIGVFNIKSLSKIKLIDMLNDHKKSEIRFKLHPFIYILIFIISMFLFVVAPTLYDSNAVTFIPCALLALPCVIIGIYGTFFSASYVLYLLKARCTNLKYRGGNLFFLGDLVSKINTNAILLATLTLTLIASIIIFLVIPVLSDWTVGYLNYRIPIDINIGNYYDPMYITENAIDYSPIEDFMNENGYEIKNYVVTESYYINESSPKESYTPYVISLSDYNKMRSMLGYETITLENNEYATHWNGVAPSELIKDFTKDIPDIELNGYKLTTAPDKMHNETLGEYLYNFPCEYVVIVDDSLCNNLLSGRTYFYANTTDTMSYEFSIELFNFISEYFDTNYESAYTRLKSLETNTITNFSLTMKTQGLYAGIILIIIVLTILSLHQLSDSFNHKERFKTLFNLGLDNRDVNKLILKQISVYFLIPFLIAMIVGIVFMYHFSVSYSEIVNVYIGKDNFILSVSISLTMIVLVYISYFIATFFGFKRNIS